jgi:cytochrome P450
MIMKTLAQLDLPHLALEEPAFGADPMPYFAAARAKHPWLARSNFGLVVHQLSAIRELFAMDDKLRPSFDGIVAQLDAKGTPWGRFTEEQLIALPADRHRLLRNTFAGKFTPRFANQLRPMMRATIRRLLHEWTPRGEFDFEEFASYFPISVMFNLVGAPLEEIAGIRSALETIGLAYSMDKSRMPAIQEAIVRLDELVQRVIAGRRANPQSGNEADLLHLLSGTADQDGITDRQLADLIMFFFIAGYDTSKNVMTFTMRLMMEHPEIYARCAGDPEYCRKVIEEALRYYNPGTTFRFTNEDLVFRDVLLPKDTMLFFTLSISGRDPVEIKDPETFDPERPILNSTRHVAFGLGIHNCLGQWIARAQLQEALHEIAQSIHNPRLAGPYGWRPFPGIWGLKGLPIAFDQRKRP